MDEETAIIDGRTRNEKIRNFFINNKKSLLVILIFLVVCLISYFTYSKYKENYRLKISDKYNSIIVEYNNNDNKEKIKNSLIELISKNDPTYSPLSLFFIIDNKLITEKAKINEFFDSIIQDVSLDKEIKNLIIYKKALYNADTSQEIELLEILKPITNSDSIWKAQSLYLIAEYFYSKDEKQKSKEFFNQIINLENANQEIKLESQKRLNRDLSE